MSTKYGSLFMLERSFLLRLFLLLLYYYLIYSETNWELVINKIGAYVGLAYFNLLQVLEKLVILTTVHPLKSDGGKIGATENYQKKST